MTGIAAGGLDRGKTLASAVLFGQAEPSVCLRWLSAPETACRQASCIEVVDTHCVRRTKLFR